MRFHAQVFIAFAAGFLAAAPPETQAAPDNTLGMAILSARVSAAGALIAGSGTTGTVAKTGNGAYHVEFDRDVTTCFYLASLNGGGQVLTQPSGTGNTRVGVGTQNSSGAFTDAEFYLLVYCPR